MYEVEALEPRILLSADGVGHRPEALSSDAAPSALCAEMVQTDSFFPTAASSETPFTSEAGLGLDSLFDSLETPSAAAVAEEVQPEEQPDVAPPAAEETAATSEPTPAQRAEAIIDEPAQPVAAAATFSWAEQLTTSLHSAQGPPQDANVTQLTRDAVIDLHGGTLNLGHQDVLKGTGVLLGTVTGNGFLRPGNSPGHTIVTNYAPGPGMVTEIEIEGPGQGTGYDWLDITNAATLDGTLQILFTPKNGYVPTLGDSFDVVTWATRSGEFANWLGTATIPGQPNWAFKPTYHADRLTLTIVQTPTLAVGVDTVILDGLDALASVGNFLDGAGEFFEAIPFLGSKLGDLADQGTAITNGLRNRLATFLNSLPAASLVTSTIEGWNNTTFGGFTFLVKGVLAHYGTLSTDPMWWDVNIELAPSSVNQALTNVLGGVFGAAFSGAPPTVTVQSGVGLDFAFGRDGSFFLEIDSLYAKASVNASGLSGFNFGFDTPAGAQSLGVTNGTVALEVSVAATPDESVLTGGRITSGTLTNLANGTIQVGNAFNLADAGTLHAAFPFALDLTFLGFSLGGDYVLKIDSDDLLSGEAPDVTMDVNSTLTVNNQVLTGSFTFKNTGTETILKASNVSFNLGAAGNRVLSIQNGAGTFVLLGSGLAGTLGMDFHLGPAIPNLTLSLTNLRLDLNTSEGAVPTIDGQAVNLPAGPYFRVSGNGTLGVTNLQASLSGNFAFEPRDANGNPGDGYEEVAVGVADLGFSFADGPSALLNVSNATGAFVFRSAGIVGSLSANVSIAVPEVSITGPFSVTLNNTGTSYNQPIDVNGTQVVINVPAGPYLRVTAGGPGPGQLATLQVLGIGVSGTFAFERKQTVSLQNVVTIAATNLSLNLGAQVNNLISLSNGNGTFILTQAGLAGEAGATLALNVPSLTLTGSFKVRINNTENEVEQTVTVNGAPVTLDLPAGPYLQVTATGASLRFLGVALQGNFSFEQRTSFGGERMITVMASGVSFDFGTNIISASNGNGFFVITAGGMAGEGSITATVNAFGGGFSHTFNWAFNNMPNPVEQEFDWEGMTKGLDLPGGPYNQLDSGPTPVAINVPIGAYTQSLSARVILTLIDPRNPSIALAATTSGGTNAVSHSTVVLNPVGENNAVRLTTTSLATAGNWNGTVFRYVDDPTITNTTAQAQWNAVTKVLTVKLNAANTPASAVVAAINGAGTPFTATLSSPDNGASGNTGTGTMIWSVATVGVSSLNATLGAGPISLQVQNGSGAFAIFETGLAGEVRVESASLAGAGAITLQADDLKFRFNSTNDDVGNPDPIVVRISDDPSEDISLQFAGAYYRQYIAVAGLASLNGLAGAVTLSGNFAFERARIDTNNDAVLEDVFKVGVQHLHFSLNAGSLAVATFNNGTGAFIITSSGLAGVATLDFQSGVVAISGTLKLEVNTTGAAVNATVPLPAGNQVINLATPNYLLVGVTNGYIHLGSIAVPLPSFQVVIVGNTVVFEPLGGGVDYVAIDANGNITTGLSFSDFAAPGPFEFVSMLRQALIWVDSFRNSNIFDLEIPFTGGKTLGDAFDWSRLFMEEIYSKMVSVELQSRNLSLQTSPVRSGNLVNAKFKIQLGTESPVEVTVNGAYSNADNNLDDLVNAFNTALSATALNGRVVARIHKIVDQIPSDPDYANRFVDDIFVLALTEAEIAKGSALNLVDLDSQIAALGFGPADGVYGDAGDTIAEQVGIVTNRYDTRGFFIELGNVLLGSPGTYQPAQQVYTYTVNESKTFNTQTLFGQSSLPFNWDLDLGPIADASLSGSLAFSATVGFQFTLGFDLGAAEVPRILSKTTVPVPANGRITQDAHFRVYLNDELTPINLTLDRARTLGNNSIQDLAADLNAIFHDYMYSGPLVSSPTRLDQLLVAQKAGDGLAISALQEIDSNNDGVPDANKDFNGDGNTDNWLGLINRIIVTSAQNDTFATELGFGNEVQDLDGNPGTTFDQIFLSGAISSSKGLFIENAQLTASLEITTPDAIEGSVRFGFVEVSTSGGAFGTLAYDGTTPAPLTASLGLRNATTGEPRLYLADLFHGTSSNNIGNMVDGPNFAGSLLARLDDIAVGGLGFSFPLGANPELSAWIPDIKHLTYNPAPYDGSNTGIFLTYPDLGNLQNFTSLNFTQIIRALDVIADNLSQISAFSFLDEPLPFVNVSVNDMIDYAKKFADLIDAASSAGSQSSLQESIEELETQIELLFNLDPNALKLSFDDGGLSGLSGLTAGGIPLVTHSSTTLNPFGDNNAITFRSKNLLFAGLNNGTTVRYVADPTITGTTATASWDAASKTLTVRINSGRTTANAIVSAVNALAAAPFSAILATPDNGASGNTGAGTVVTSSFVAGGGVNNSRHASVTLMPGGDNNNFQLTTTNLATAATYNGAVVRIVGDAAVTGTSAQVSWDATSKLLTIKINPGKTTANAIISAINAASTPWNAALAPPDNGLGTNTGAGGITTTALKFSLAYSTGYADSLPFQLDLNELVGMLVGDSNAAVRAFLDIATTLVQVSGSGNLTVSASAAVSLDFGLDLTNPSTIRPFLYDSTGIVLKAKVLGTNIDIEASLGSVFGIFIRDGKLTLDADGDPETDAGDGDQGATFRLGLRNNNGDNRHYFDEPILNAESIDLSLQGGVSATLPIFAPFEGIPLSGDDDGNGDGYPDNYLVVEIADIVRLFQGEEVNTRASEAGNTSQTVRFAGTHNDLRIISTTATNYRIVFLNTTNGGAANASYNAGTNTLTVNIDGGDTTAIAARDAIKGVAGFATTALTADDDANPATTTNTGAGKLNKVKLVAPDFSQLFADLELCDVISANIGKILDGLDSLLGTIQDGLNEIVFSTNLPLIGPGLQGAANFIEDFRNGLLQSLRNEVNAAGGNGLTALENAIKKAFWNTLGPGGLDLLVNFETGEQLDDSLGFSQLDVTLDCDTGLIVNVRLAKSVALLDTTQNPIDFDIGVPGFGLEVDGNVVVSIGFDLKFGFGFNKEDGFYFNTGAPANDPELVIEFTAEIPGLHAAGELLFLQLDVMDDPDDPSIFSGFFRVDLKDPNNDQKLTFAEITSSGTQFDDVIGWVLGAEADINLDLIASFGGSAAFPRILAEFHLDWLADTNTGFGTPQIQFNNIYLDLGSFISEFLGPILDKIQDITEPLQPILDLVQARIPVLSDLAGEDITLLTLAEVFGLLEPSTVQFIEDVIGIIELINSLEGLGEGSILIPFGGFNLVEDANGERKGIQNLQDIAAKTYDEIANAIENADNPGASSTYKSASAGFVGDVGSLSNFSIPVFDNPSELFNLFTGGNVRLVEWRMPTFKFEFTYTQKIPIYPPLYAQFGGSLGAQIDIGFGYDTYGIQKFIASEDKNFLDILDGFYVIDFDANGNERPELTLSGKIFAGASISLLIAEAGVIGGIEAIFTFDLNDVNDDGRVRVSEIIANAQQDPRCIFDIHGEINLFLEAYLIIDLFFFSIDKTWRLADITLLEFDITCPEPVLAELSGSDLLLNIGSRAAQRLEIDTADNSERFVVKHAGGSAGSETVEVEWGNYKQTFENVGRVVVQDAGQGDDHIDLRGVLSPSEVHGGLGNDTIFLSDGAGSVAYGDAGNDTITASSSENATGVRLYGGDGNDLLIPGTVSITIYGDGGNDTITGTDEADYLYGDDGTGTLSDGADTIDGKDGNDIIRGGKGNDVLEGGAGDDWVRGDDGADIIRGSRGDDILDGGAGDDKLYGSSGRDLLLGGAGSDWANGHGDTDLLIGEHEPSITINGLAISEANLAALRAAVAGIPTAGITVHNLSGGTSPNTGHDLLIGGGGVDALFGGPGNDFLYGGNFMNTGETEVIEEDANDFFDGGPGNDTIFGDDSMGRTGDRNTGIAIKSSIWFDANGNNLRDSDEKGFAGVTVRLYRQSDSSLIATEATDVEGAFAFVGLDPNYYYLTFSVPSGMSFVAKNAGGATFADDASDDNDAVLTGPVGRTDPFEVSYDQTESAVTAGYTGPAKVSIADQTVSEGNSGQTNVTFTVTLSHLQPYPVEIQYRTVDGTATAASGDYLPVRSTVLTFAPGELSKTITLVVAGDSMYEPHEQFELEIQRAQHMRPGSPVDLAVSDAQVLVTITNDDPIPSISIQDFQQVGVDHDNDPSTPNLVDENLPARFVVTLSNPSQFPVTVQWRSDMSPEYLNATMPGAATPSGFPGADFQLASGTLTFLPGVTNRVITVTTLDDNLDEVDESFVVDLFNPTYATIADGRAWGIIADDDAPVSVYIVPVTPAAGQPFTTEVIEGNAGMTNVSFHVRLSAVSGKVVTVHYNTSPGTAAEFVYSLGTDLVDYVATPNANTPEEEATVIFQPGELSKLVTVQVYGDTLAEGETDQANALQKIETFFVNLFGADGANIAANTLAGQNNHATVKIIDDDSGGGGPDQGPWSVYFGATTYTVQEPDSGSTTVNVSIRRTPGSSNAVAVFYTSNGTATAGSDYTAVFRQVVYFQDNELVKVIPVTIHSDAVLEGTETIMLSLRNPTGGPVRAAPDSAVIRIIDDETPEVAFLMASAYLEGSGGGSTTRDVWVYLRDPETLAPVVAPPGGITVQYQVIELTARRPSDYTVSANPVSGTLTFNEGDGFMPVKVDIVKDDVPELSETLAVRLSSPQGATLAMNGQATIVTIIDDDLTPISGQVFYDHNGNGFKDLSEAGVKDVTVKVTYLNNGVPVTNTVTTNAAGLYTTNVLLGSVSVVVDGTTVTSPYKNTILAFFGSGSYETTTANESQTVKFEGIVGLPAFADVGYKNSFTFSLPTGADDVGRGGTDDTIFGGPGDDTIDAGAGDDHIVGGHWMTATDSNAPVNLLEYDAVVKAITTDLHVVYDEGPIFEVDTSGVPAHGKISGQIWLDLNNNSQQDAGELLTELVFVNLYDCDGNPINTVVTSNGEYTFDKLFLKEDGSGSHYVVEFALPHDFDFISYVPKPEAIDSDVIVGGRTEMIMLSNGSPTATDQDAGVKASDVARLSITGGLRFDEPSYSVSESVKSGKVTITVTRSNSYSARAAVVYTEDGTATANTNYLPVRIPIFFDIGETSKTVDIPILDTDTIGICTTPLTFKVTLRDVTGRLYDRATVYIGGESFGNITDDDTIHGGTDWDLILGDSGNIQAKAVIADPASLVNIVRSGGPGKDTIYGDDGPDWIDAQLFDDYIAGGFGQDQILAGLGNDTVYLEWDNDVVNGDYGRDVVISTRDVPWIELEMTGADTAKLHHRMSEGAFPLSTFALEKIEMAHLFGGPQDNTFDIENWSGSAIISGAGGRDTLLVETNEDLVLKDATFIESMFFFLLHGFFKDAALSLPNDATYHLGSLENVQLTGGLAANTFNAAAYSRPVTFIGGGGNDVLIGGSANDTFRFLADNALGTDTVTGNGGRDTLTFEATVAAVTVNLATLAPTAQVVNANLSLLLTDLIENATGGSGNDSLLGNNLSNVLAGGPGDDTLVGGPGNETYVFDTDSPWGQETITEDAGHAGYDVIDFSGTTTRSINLNLSILGTPQVVNSNLTLTIVGEGFDEVRGGALNDVLRGNSIGNVLRGGPGNDLLDGKGGDDTLDGGAGDDDLNGGDGVDTINETANTHFTLTNSSLVRGTSETDSLNNIEVANLVGGANSNTFTLTGWTGTGSINGRGGNDTLVWAANANFTLSNGSILVSTALGPMSLASIEAASLTGGESDNTLDASAFTGLTQLNGGNGDDTLRGGWGLDFLRGGMGDDTLTGNRGNDILDGGDGFDTLIEDLTDAAWEVEFAIANNLLVTTQKDPTPLPSDETITETDLLIGIEAADLTGSPQNDTFDVSNWTAGSIQVHGGVGGTDMIKVQVPVPSLHAPNGGTVTLTNTGVSFTGSSATITFASIEVALLLGTDRDETFDASTFTGASLIDAKAGNDILIAGPGINYLYGREGDDRFVFNMDGGVTDTDLVEGGDGIDTLDFSGFSVGVNVDLSNTGVLQPTAPAELQLYFSSEDLEILIGGSGNDVLIGNSLDNTFTGGRGNDTITGNGGNDTLVETGDTNFTLTDAQLTDSAGFVDTLTDIEIAILTGGPGANTIDASGFSGTTTLSGLGGNDSLVGGSGPDTLIGGAGDDSLKGGPGNDVYLFDLDDVLGSDEIVETNALADGADMISFAPTTTVGAILDLSRTTPQPVHATNLTLTLSDGSAIEYAWGGDQADRLIGNAADNIFVGGLGEDQFDGNGGALDAVFETRDADMLLTDTTLTIGGETDRLNSIQWAVLIGGASNNTLDATSFNGIVWLLGEGGNDRLFGGNGDDSLRGGEGNDELWGGAGDDDLRGGEGNDTYVFDQSFNQGSDSIRELAGEGFADTLLGVGLNGIDVDLNTIAVQVISPNLTLTLVFLSTVEFSF